MDNKLAPIADVFTLDGVGFHYPGHEPALQNLSLRIHPGDRVAILGSNGSGKSTLLKLLDGLLTPTCGRIQAFGSDLTEQSLLDTGFSRSFRQRVGFIFQRSEVQLFSPTVWDEIAFGPLQLGLPAGDIRSRVDDVLAMLDLGPLRDRAPFQLSGGEQKKVAIACVLSMSPQVLLLDEPTAALDPRSQRWLIDLLQTLQSAGKTTIMATHDLDLVPQLADRALVMGSDHTLLSDAPVSETLHNHALLHEANLAHHHLSAQSPSAGILEAIQGLGPHDHMDQ